MKELKGVCNECLGCNRLELPQFEGVEKCEYCTLEDIEMQINIEEIVYGRNMERH